MHTWEAVSFKARASEKSEKRTEKEEKNKEENPQKVVISENERLEL